MKIKVNLKKILTEAIIYQPQENPDSSRLNTAVNSGIASGILSAGVGMAFNADADQIGYLAGVGTALGAGTGYYLHNKPDTLVNSAVIPAGVVGVTAPLVNANLDDERLKIDPLISAAMTGAIGSGMWYLRKS